MNPDPNENPDKQTVVENIKQLFANDRWRDKWKNVQGLIKYIEDHFEDIRNEASRNWNFYLERRKYKSNTRCAFGDCELQIIIMLLTIMNFSTTSENQNIGNEIMKSLGYMIYKKNPNRLQEKNENLKRKTSTNHSQDNLKRNVSQDCISQDNLKRNVSQDCISPKSKRSKINKSGQEDSFEKESQTINNTNRSLPSQCRKEESAENSFALNNEVETPRSTQEESTNMYSLDFGYSVIFSYTSSRDNQEQDPSSPSARENSLSNQEEQNDIDKIIQSRTTVTTPDHSVDYLIAQQHNTNWPEYSNKRKSMESPKPSPTRSHSKSYDNNNSHYKNSRLFGKPYVPQEDLPENVFNPKGEAQNFWEQFP